MPFSFPPTVFMSITCVDHITSWIHVMIAGVFIHPLPDSFHRGRGTGVIVPSRDTGRNDFRRTVTDKRSLNAGGEISIYPFFFGIRYYSFIFHPCKCLWLSLKCQKWKVLSVLWWLEIQRWNSLWLEKLKGIGNSFLLKGVSSKHLVWMPSGPVISFIYLRDEEFSGDSALWHYCFQRLKFKRRFDNRVVCIITVGAQGGADIICLLHFQSCFYLCEWLFTSVRCILTYNKINLCVYSSVTFFFFKAISYILVGPYFAVESARFLLKITSEKSNPSTSHFLPEEWTSWKSHLSPSFQYKNTHRYITLTLDRVWLLVTGTQSWQDCFPWCFPIN